MNSPQATPESVFQQLIAQKRVIKTSTETLLDEKAGLDQIIQATLGIIWALTYQSLAIDGGPFFARQVILLKAFERVKQAGWKIAIDKSGVHNKKDVDIDELTLFLEKNFERRMNISRDVEGMTISVL